MASILLDLLCFRSPSLLQDSVRVTSLFAEVCDIFLESLPCSDCSCVSVVCWLRCDVLNPVPLRTSHLKVESFCLNSQPHFSFLWPRKVIA